MSKSALQHSFFEQMADPQVFRAMFEHLRDVFFFVKDRESRMIAGSQNLVERLGLKRENEMIGQPDEAFFQPHIARAFLTMTSRSSAPASRSQTGSKSGMMSSATSIGF